MSEGKDWTGSEEIWTLVQPCCDELGWPQASDLFGMIFFSLVKGKVGPGTPTLTAFQVTGQLRRQMP